MNNFWGHHPFPGADETGRDQYTKYPGSSCNDNGYNNYHEQYSSSTTTTTQSNSGWDRPCSSSQNWHCTEPQAEEDPDGLPYESEEEDLELARKRKELQVIEEQIMLKKASLALKTVDVKTPKRRHFTEESKPLKERVQHILQTRNSLFRTNAVLHPPQRSQATSRRRSFYVQYDHPLRLRVAAALERRFAKPPEQLQKREQPAPFVRTPAPLQKEPLPVKREVNKTNQGFMRFLNVLNQGVDINKLTEMANKSRDVMAHSRQNGAKTDSAAISVKPSVIVREKIQEDYSLLNIRNKRNDIDELTEIVNGETDEMPHRSQTDCTTGSVKPPVIVREKLRDEDEPQKHLRNILESLGLSLGKDEISRLGDRTQERLYGKKQRTEEEVDAPEEKTQTEHPQQKSERKHSPAHRRPPSGSKSTSKSNKSRSRTPSPLRQRRSRSSRSPRRTARSSRSPQSPYGTRDSSSKSVSVSDKSRSRKPSPCRRRRSRSPRSPRGKARSSWSPQGSRHSYSPHRRRDSHSPRRRSKSPSPHSRDHWDSHLQHLPPLQPYPYTHYQYSAPHFPPQMNPGAYCYAQYTAYYNYWPYNQAPVLPGPSNCIDQSNPQNRPRILTNLPAAPPKKPKTKKKKNPSSVSNQPNDKNPPNDNNLGKKVRKTRSQRKARREGLKLVQRQADVVRELMELEDTQAKDWETDISDTITRIKETKDPTGGETASAGVARGTNGTQQNPATTMELENAKSLKEELSHIIEQQKVRNLKEELSDIITRIKMFSDPAWAKTADANVARGSGVTQQHSTGSTGQKKEEKKKTLVFIERDEQMEKPLNDRPGPVKMSMNKGHLTNIEDVKTPFGAVIEDNGEEDEPEPMPLPTEEEIKANLKKKLEAFNSRMKSNVRQTPGLLMPQSVKVEDEI